MTEDYDTLSFKCPAKLSEAVRKLAGRDLVSLSDVIRGAVLRDLRSRGLLDDGRTA
jgi:hypothetical protein